MCIGGSLRLAPNYNACLHHGSRRFENVQTNTRRNKELSLFNIIAHTNTRVRERVMIWCTLLEHLHVCVSHVATGHRKYLYIVCVCIHVFMGISKYPSTFCGCPVHARSICTVPGTFPPLNKRRGPWYNANINLNIGTSTWKFRTLIYPKSRESHSSDSRLPIAFRTRNGRFKSSFVPCSNQYTHNPPSLYVWWSVSHHILVSTVPALLPVSTPPPFAESAAVAAVLPWPAAECQSRPPCQVCATGLLSDTWPSPADLDQYRWLL